MVSCRLVASYAKREKNLIKSIETQSNHHPDDAIKEFYKAFLELYANNDKFKKVILKIFEGRKDITDKHFVNISYRALQYVLIYNRHKLAISNYKKNDWKKEIRSILNTKKDYDTYVKILKEENTQTTIYQRYIGPKLAIYYKYQNKPIKILDIGCGLNIGLPGIEINMPFKRIRDNTKSKKLNATRKKELNFKQGFAIDINNPIEKRKWALACGFYPSELENIGKVEKVCDPLWDMTKVKFYQCNLLELEDFWKANKLPKMDIAIASTILYQLPKNKVDRALSEIRKTLKHPGLLIINDFMSYNGNFRFDVNWFQKEKSSYKTIILNTTKKDFEKPLEFITWDNGRCKEAFPGKNFDEIVKS